ncbi:MAG: hypothetical protein Q9165_007635 [Trypethelium subeluteriae]
MVEGEQPPTWKFTQCFGDKGDVEDITEADIISTVEFDQTGNYLATGDKGGRVVLFERNETKKTCEYKFHTEFQSHEPEFDYLKSLEIEEKINKIKWCRRQNASHYLLSTNDKTIKLWKVFEKSLKVVAENNLTHDPTPGGAVGGGAPIRNPNVHFRSALDLKLPRLTHHDTVVAAVPRKTYANAHAYHINSISVNSDGETFISSDDLRINLWNLNIQNESFNIVDIKPANMEELTEVITAAEFHPQSCNWFMYASSKGTIKLADMRESALCDQHAKQFEQEEDPASRSFFSEIISSISDVRFSYDGRYILSRDYLTVKIWDVNMERQPVKTIPIHEHLRPRLCDTYENDSIFDKFEVVFSGDAKNVMTGSYNNNFMIYPSETEKDTEIVLQADKSAFKAKKVGVPTPMNSATSPTGSTNSKKGNSRANSPAAGAGGQGGRMRKETDADQIDFNKKILHMSWHPSEDSIAIAATNNVFALEAIVNLAAYPFQNRPQTSNTPSEKPPVPVYKWGVVAAMFFSVNMLNNWAFAFNISVPVHIILRSFGSVTTMGAGWLRGRRYSRIQLLSVVMLTLGVIQSAWADSESKGQSMKAAASISDSTSIFGMGLLVLLIAQLLSAFMGTYVQDVYAYHTAHWTENLFYSHFLGLPFFVPLAWTLTTQYLRLSRTPPLAEMPSTSRYMSSFSPAYDATAASPHGSSSGVGGGVGGGGGGGGLLSAVPGGLVMLLMNAVTQLACISGVNLLSAKSSAVTVTIVLNIRKLVSFMLSIWLFGNPLSLKMLAGAVLVFGSGALYGWETTVGIRLREEKARKRGEEVTVDQKRF